MSNEIPLACDLTAISNQDRQFHKNNAEEVFANVLEVRELSKGYAFSLPAETKIIEQTGAFISRERLCCPFFHFVLEIEPDRGPVRLKVTGDKRVKKFVKKYIVDPWVADDSN